MDPKLTDDEIDKLSPLVFYYKYYSDQIVFREISPLLPGYNPF